MSRAGNVDVVTVKPQNNIYTVLTIISLIVTLAAFFMLFAKASTVFPGGLFS
jgi:hypothetical protein